MYLYGNLLCGLLYIYFGPHFLLGILSFVVNVCALCILLGKFPASSETRHQILKQNVVYILVLGSETALIIPFWLGISSNIIPTICVSLTPAVYH